MLVFGGAASDPPYEYLDSEGQPRGFNIELIRALERESGVEIEIRLAPWHEIMVRLDQGEFDLVSLGYSEDRARRYDYIAEIWTLRQVLLFPATRDPLPRLPQDLHREVVAVVESGWVHGYLQSLPEEERPQLRPVASIADAIEALVQGKVTAAAGNALHLRHVTTRLGVAGFVSAPLQGTPYGLATLKGRGRDLDFIRDAVSRLREKGEIARLIEQHLTEPPPEFSWRRHARLALALLTLAVLVIAGIALWNRALTRRVAARTSDLAALAQEKSLLAQTVAESELRYRQLVESVRAVVWRADANSLQPSFVSQGALSMLGFPVERWINEPGFWTERVHVRDRERFLSSCADAAAGEPRELEYRIVAADGREVWVRNTFRSVVNANGRDAELIGVMVDVTSRKLLEERLAQSQKMEAIGRLAGGVAHDFNNLLTVVTGYCELLLGELPQGGEEHQWSAKIQQASAKAAALTQQLLAFGRKQVLAVEPLDLATVVAGLEEMLQRLVGENITLVTKLPADLGAVMVDRGQIEAALMNLVANARDAMPRGGLLTIEVAEAAGGDAKFGEPEKASDSWIMLSVRDTGVGMDAETQARVFEPFFTTKGLGQGTGLGLASVYGVVQQSGGHIEVESSPGIGTTFRLYLPRSGDSPRQAPSFSVAANAAAPTAETILLVDDDESVLQLNGKVLRRQGYTVLEARHAGEALVIVERHPLAIHLLITDIVMPQMNGLELAQRAIPMRQEMQVLFVSGYTEQAALPAEMLDDETHFLQKPFTPTTLIERVRALLELGARSGGSISPHVHSA